MNIFLRELKANLKSLIIWGVITLLFVSVGFSKFSAYANNPDMLAILDQMPAGIMAAFNMDAFNLTTITGFFGVMFSYFSLLLSVAAVMWGSDIITKEERDKTVEFTLTLPVRRERVITAKILAAVVNCFGLLLITGAGILVSSTAYEPDSAYFAFVSLSMIALFVTQMIFLAVGVFLGCAMKQFKQANSIAIALLLATYFISVISGMSEKLGFLKYFSPFKYFDPVLILRESKIDIFYLGLSAVIIAVSITGAYLTYSKRDLYI